MLFTLIIGQVTVVSAGNENPETSAEKQDIRGIIVLPILMYTPETCMAGGLMMNYHFQKADANRPSVFMPSMIYTQNKQISMELSTDIYWQQEEYHFNSYICYNKFPDKFYGIGNQTTDDMEEDYTPKRYQLQLNFQKRFLSHIYAGLQYELEKNTMTELEDGGLLETGLISGSSGGSVSGVGISVNYDSRDDVFYPAQGGYYQFSAKKFSEIFGSDFSFTRIMLDARRYYQVNHSHVIAVNGYLNFMTGMPPFNMMSLLGEVGERNLLRGYYQGRFRDRQMIALQAEYRVPLWWRFGAAAFAGIGDVAHDVDQFQMNELKYSYGLGLRFRLSSQEKINVRIDFGLGEDTSGLYFTIGEAF